MDMKLITVKEFCRRLAEHGVNRHPRTVVRWFKDGSLAGRRVARQIYIDPQEVERIVKGGEND